MSNEEFPIIPSFASGNSGENEGEEGVLYVTSYVIPKEGGVIPRGQKFKSQKFGGVWVEYQIRFRSPDGSTHTELIYNSSDRPLDPIEFVPPAKLNRGRNDFHYRQKHQSNGWSEWMSSGYYYIAESPTITVPPSTISSKDFEFSGTGDSSQGSVRVQLRRSLDNADLTGWVSVNNNTWRIPLSLTVGVYTAYLAGSGPNWQVESRSNDINFTVSWTPTITTPANNTAIQSSSGFTIIGRASPNAKVNLHITEQDVVALGINVSSNGDWSTFVNNRTNMKLQFVTQQYSGTFYTPHSAVHTVYLVGKPIITRPQDGIVLTPKPTITGTGCPGAKIQIVEGGVGNHVFGEGVVAANGSWSVTITTALPERPINLTCNQTLQSVVSVWADSHQFSILSAPVVANPGLVDVLPTLTGTHSTGVPGIQIDIYRDLSDEKIGQGVTAANGAWSATITTALVPGVAGVTALLRFYSNASTRSAPVALTVRPAPPVITQIIHSGTTTIFKGTGFPGATVDIHPSSGTPNATALVNSQGYFETTPITIVPGTIGSGWGARQKIANGSEWLFSIYHPDAPVFDVPTPVPTVNTPTLIGQIPTVTGRGSVWQGLAAATVVVEFIGTTTVTLSPATVTATGDWTATTATAVAPGSYTVSVRQLMNGVYSLPVTAPAPLIINPLAPTISSVVLEDLSPRIKGTCWPGASLSLTYTGETTHPVSSADGNWEFRRDIKFKPGKHSFSVIQTFGGQGSVAAGPEMFTVETPKPVITFPGKQQETDFRPEIKGTNGYEGATVAVFDNKVEGPALGQTIVPASGVWTVSLSKDLTLGEHDIYALQTFETQASERSVAVLFNVMVPVPSISVPADNGDYGRRSEFAGKALPGAKVTLYLVENPGLPNETETEYLPPGGVVVDVKGNWKANVFFAQVGSKNLRIKQAYAGGTRASVTRTFRTITNAPLIESPNAGESVNPVAVVLSGHSFPGDNVKVRRKGYTEVIGDFVVNADGHWSGTLTRTLNGASPYSLEAWSNRDNHGGDISEAATIILQDLANPLIVHPADGDVLVPRVLFSGQGLPGATIQVADLFNPAINHAPITTVDQSGDWSVEGNTDLNPGPNWVIVQQTLGEKKSPWVRSERFMIEYPLTGFSAPTVDRPFPGEEVGLKPLLAGTGVAGAKVYVRQNGKDLAHAWVDAQGRWALRLPVFAEGSQSLTVIQASHEIWSAELKPNSTFEVVQVSAGFPAPTIESPTAGATVDTRFWMSGKGMPGAVVRARDFYNGAILYGEGSVDAYGQWRMCLSHAAALKNFTITVQQTLDEKNSLFSPEVTVNVENALPAPILESHSNGEQIAPVALLKGRGHPGATVFLYKSGDTNNPLASANVTEDGYWECVTKPLPLGNIRMGGRQMLPSIVGPWMNEFTFQVVNAG
jgi:hypothetical protein